MNIKNTTTKLLHRRKLQLLSPRLQSACFGRRRHPHCHHRPHRSDVNTPLPPPSSIISIVANRYCSRHRSRLPTSLPSMFAENIITISCPPVHPPNGMRTDPEVWDQVISIWQNCGDLRSHRLQQLWQQRKCPSLVTCNRWIRLFNGEGHTQERGGNNNCSAREGKLVDVMRWCHKRQNINQLGQTRGEREVCGSVDKRMGGGGTVSRCNTATSRCKQRVRDREDGHVRWQCNERWRKAEAVRREVTQQSVSKQEAKGRRGTSGQEEMVSQKPSKMTQEESSVS